jgi:hypothetical protein
MSTACHSSSQQVVTAASPAPATSVAANWSLKTCNISADDTTGLSRDLNTNIDAAEEFAKTIERMLRAKQYDQLDCLADHYRATKERFSGGVWRLHAMYVDLSQAAVYPQHPTEEDRLDHITRLDHWISANPKSATARVALALTYIDYAWAARGDGYSDSVSDSGWKLFEDRVNRASDLLDDASKLPTKDPEWYFVKLQLATTGQSWGLEKARAMFEEAHKFEPGYFYYGRQFAFYLKPQWAGEEGDEAKFATEISDRIGGDEGDAYYFRLAVDLICDCKDSPKFDWPRIVKGYKASEKLYGPSMIDMNEIAFMASHYNIDPIVANDVMPRIGDQWSKDKWENEKMFQDTRDWAAKAAPLAAKNRATAAEAETNGQTPDGVAYKAAFEKKYKQLVQECVHANGATADKFETLTSVAETGAVEDMKVYWNGEAAICVYTKLKASKDNKTVLFPKPPHGSYWVKLDLDAGEFLTTASK